MGDEGWMVLGLEIETQKSVAVFRWEVLWSLPVKNIVGVGVKKLQEVLLAQSTLTSLPTLGQELSELHLY